MEFAQYKFIIIIVIVIVIVIIIIIVTIIIIERVQSSSVHTSPVIVYGSFTQLPNIKKGELNLEKQLSQRNGEFVTSAYT